MSARDDYPPRRDIADPPIHDAMCDEIDRLRADKARLFSLATDEAERAATLSAQVAAVSAALDQYEMECKRYVAGRNSHFVEAVAKAVGR